MDCITSSAPLVEKRIQNDGVVSLIMLGTAILQIPKALTEAQGV